MMKQNGIYEQDSNDDQPAPIKPYNVQELADLYSIKRRTFQRWISRKKALIGPRVGHLYNIRQVEIMFHEFGPPYVKRESNNGKEGLR
jgi:hypothetical protein